MGDVLFSFAGAAPGVESKIFPLRFPRSAGNVLVLYCSTPPCTLLQDFANMAGVAPGLFNFVQWRCGSELPGRVGKILESLQETCTAQAMQNSICKLVLSIRTKRCRDYMDY